MTIQRNFSDFIENSQPRTDVNKNKLFRQRQQYAFALHILLTVKSMEIAMGSKFQEKCK